MCELRKQDYVRFTIRGEIHYGYVNTIGKKNAGLWDFTAQEERILPLERLEFLAPVQLTPAKLRKLCRYEEKWSVLCGDTPPELMHYTWKKRYTLTVDDVFAAIGNIRKEHADNETVSAEWFEPLYLLQNEYEGDESCIRFEDAPADSEQIPHLPSRPDYLEVLFAEEGLIESLLDEEVPFTESSAAIEQYLADMLEDESKPVLERRYTDGDKETYLRRLGRDDRLQAASAPELAVYRAFAEELCAKDNVTALRCKGYGCYGGDTVYDCDWNASLECMLKLLELTGDAMYANTLGYIYYYGRCWDGEPQYEQAFRYFSIGAAGGYFESRYKLADMFVHGYAVPKNTKIACEIISELYSENLRRFQNGNPCKFADVALRMGNYEQSGYRGGTNIYLAYLYYLQADYAIRQRMQYHWFGDDKVAAGIRKSLDSLLASGQIEKPRRTAEVSLQAVLHHYLEQYRRLQLEIRELKNGDLKLTVRIAPFPDDEYPPKLFITVPEAGFCGRLEAVCFRVKHADVYQMSGEYGDVILFDDISGYDLMLNGKIAATIEGEFWFTNPDKASGRKYRIASVCFEPGGRQYDYLLTLDGVSAGDTVIVMTGRGETEVTVISVSERTESELALPLGRYKKILRRK